MDSLISPEATVMLFISALIDGIIFILTFIVGVGLVPSLVVDLIAVIVLVPWMMYRSKLRPPASEETDEEEEEDTSSYQMPERKDPATNLESEKKESAKKKTEDKKPSENINKKPESTGAKTGEKAGVKTGEKTGAKTATRAATKTASRAGTRALKSFIGSMLPVIQIIPFWTLSTLCELVPKSGIAKMLTKTKLF